MKADKPELFDAIDAFVRRFEEISGTFGEMVAALKEIAANQKATTVALREIKSELSYLRR